MKKGFETYKKCAKISFKIMLVIITVILTIFLLRTFASDGIGGLDI